MIEIAASGFASGAGLAGLRDLVRVMRQYADDDNAGYYVHDALAKLDFSGFPKRERPQKYGTHLICRISLELRSNT